LYIRQIQCKILQFEENAEKVRVRAFRFESILMFGLYLEKNIQARGLERAGKLLSRESPGKEVASREQLLRKSLRKGTGERRRRTFNFGPRNSLQRALQTHL